MVETMTYHLILPAFMYRTSLALRSMDKVYVRTCLFIYFILTLCKPIDSRNLVIYDLDTGEIYPTDEGTLGLFFESRQPESAQMDNQVDIDNEPAAIFSSDQFFAPFYEEEAEVRNENEADSDLDPDWLNALQQFIEQEKDASESTRQKRIDPTRLASRKCNRCSHVSKAYAYCKDLYNRGNIGAVNKLVGMC